MADAHLAEGAGRHPSSVPHHPVTVAIGSAVASSIAECARRLLRTDGAQLRVPSGLMAVAHESVLCVSDVAPSISLEVPEENLSFAVEIVDSGVVIARLGGDEPDFDVCWVPVDDLERCWEEFSEVMIALASAGYPGCSGCGGREANEPWNEMYRRSMIEIR